MKLYHYKVAMSDRTFDYLAKNDIDALRQVKALCRVWKDPLVQVTDHNGNVIWYKGKSLPIDNWNCAT